MSHDDDAGDYGWGGGGGDYDDENDEDIMYPEGILDPDDPLHYVKDNGDNDGGETNLQTLAQLARGPNREAALNEAQDKVYVIAVLCDVLLHRLSNSSGGRSPYIFDTSTRKYLEKNTRLNVTTHDGRPPPFTHQHETNVDLTNDVNV